LLRIAWQNEESSMLEEIILSGAVPRNVSVLSADPPANRRAAIEAEIQRLRLQLWSSPEDKIEIEAAVAELKAELAALDRHEIGKAGSAA
jgi:hypothetical protein